MHGHDIKKLINSLGLRVSSASIEDVFFNHPDFPSLSALSDSFHSWKVPNVAVKLTPSQLEEITYPAIAYIETEKDKELVLIHSFEQGIVNYQRGASGIVHEPVNEFSTKWKGVMLLLSFDEQSGEPDYKINHKKEVLQKTESYLSYGILLSIGLMLILKSNDLLMTGILLFSAIGLATSVFLLQGEFGTPNEIIEKLCNFNSKTDCSTITKSSASRFLGWLSWSEIGFFYFAGNLLALLFAFFTDKPDGVLSILLVINGLALPYTFFSVYYQAFIARKWCTLCLLVQGVLWISFILLLPYFADISFIHFQAIQKVSVGFLMPVALWFVVKPFLLKAKDLPTAKKQAVLYYRHTELFTSFLQKQRYVEVGNLPHEIVLGNPDAELEVLIVCNVFCNPCAKAHHELDDLVEYYGEEMKLIIRFMAESNPEAERHIITRHILSLEASIQPHAIKDWFSLMDYKKWSVKYPAEVSSYSEVLLKYHNEWCKEARIEYTPSVFINGYELKEPYTYNQLKYHLRSLIETNIHA
jgi:uncharacterized membrane protein